MGMDIEQVLHHMGQKGMGTLPIIPAEVSTTLDSTVAVAHILLSRVAALGIQGYQPSWPVIKISSFSEDSVNCMLVYSCTGKMSLQRWNRVSKIWTKMSERHITYLQGGMTRIPLEQG